MWQTATERIAKLTLPQLSTEVSSRTHYLIDGDRIEEVNAPARASYTLVGRGSCLFLTLDVSNVPAAAVIPFIDREVRKHSPWPRAGYYSTGAESKEVALWVWDAESVEQAMAELPEAARKKPILPEPALFPGGSEGIEVRPCTSGIDYQFWQGGRLRVSLWSAEALSQHEAEVWSRSVGGGPLPGATPGGPVWAEQPWSEAVLDWRTLVRDERSLMWGGALLLMLVFCFEIGMTSALAMKRTMAESNINDLQESLGEKLEYRLAAERLSAANDSLAELLPAYTQLEVVSEFTSLLSGQEYELVEWEYRLGSLQVIVKNPELDSREVVSRLESGEFFGEVRIEPGLREGEHELSLAIDRSRS